MAGIEVVERQLWNIVSEDEAFSLLEAILEGRFDPQQVEVRFTEWPKLHIRLVGEKFHATLTPSVMQSIIDVQKNIYRSYASAKYGEPNAQRLSKEEREELELQVSVGEGSSVTDIDLTGVVQNFFSQVLPKMDGNQALILALGLAFTAAGTFIWRTYLNNRKEVRMAEVAKEGQVALIEQMREATQQETRRAEIFAGLAAENSKLATIASLGEDGRASLLKAFGRSDSVEIDGYEITGEAANVLSKNARHTAIEVRIDGHFRVLGVDSSDPDEFKLKVKNTITGQELTASVQDETLGKEHVTAIQSAEWEHRVVALSINARELRGAITKAVVLQAELVPEQEGQA